MKPILRDLLNSGWSKKAIVDIADSSHRGLIEAATRRPDLLILYLGLPDGDGCDVIADIRTWSSLPNLNHLSARSDEQDKIIVL